MAPKICIIEFGKFLKVGKKYEAARKMATYQVYQRPPRISMLKTEVEKGISKVNEYISPCHLYIVPNEAYQKQPVLVNIIPNTEVSISEDQ